MLIECWSYLLYLDLGWTTYIIWSEFLVGWLTTDRNIGRSSYARRWILFHVAKKKPEKERFFFSVHQLYTGISNIFCRK